MDEVVLGWPVVFWVRLIGAWPGYRNVCTRTFIWLFMLATIVCQLMYVLENVDCNMNSLMEAVAMAVTHILSFLKIFVIWYNRGYIEECLDIMAEDWKNITNNKHFVLMSRHAKIARRLCIWVMGSYCAAVLAFVIRMLSNYASGTSDYIEKKLLIPAKYPFDVHRRPTYEIMMGIGSLQAILIAAGNFLTDNFLITLIAHVSGQLLIVHDRLLQFADVNELPGIIRKHQGIIHFAENIVTIFKWIGLVEFLSGSVIICALGFVLVTTLESDLDGPTMIKFGNYIVAMITGVFIYCCAGNILIEKSLNIRDAVYGSCWADLPPQTSKILIIIMMRADSPLCITAGNFFAMNYESFISIMKTAVSYLSVIRASSE